jgi:hypothetical protein
MAGGATIPATNFYNPANTYVFKGVFYSSCGINLAATSAFAFSGTTITVTTATAHGLSKGSYIYAIGLGGGTPAPNGAFVVATTPTATTFTYTAITAPTVAITNATGQTNLFARPAGYVEPRAYDGGVAFSAGAAVPNQQLIRQTRRYFRYQSGKGIQFSTGSSLKPYLFTPALSASGTTVGSTITVTTPFPHNLTTNCTIRVVGVDQAGYNGDYEIASVTSVTSFTYTAKTTLEALTATGLVIRISPLNWYGASNRIGFFDQQNGFFFEFDGQTLYAVVRNSVTQLVGRVQVTQGSGTVTGTSTTFSSTLKPNDYIVIRGQSYKVVTIASDTSLTISPEYRGATVSQGGYIVSKTVEARVPQSQWFDVCDGTSSISNPSGYLLDLTRMQMWYIDYSWYGAGAIRFGFRGKDGAVTYVHQIQNNNVKYEAYMRSGNMSAHYESNGQMPATYSTATCSSAATSIAVADTSLFPSSGTLAIRGNAATSPTANAIEYVTYTNKTSTTFTGLTRAQTGGNITAQTFTYSATSPQAVEYLAPDTAPSLSHWGSSVIMDGLYNDDKSLLFNYGMTTAISTATANQTTAVLAIRIAPTADNGLTGTLGNKEIVNRMQLQLSELGLYTTGAGYFIQLFLNGFATAAFAGVGNTFASPTSPTSSLAQVALNTTLGTSITNGESVAAAYTNASGSTTLDLTQVRDLGNSILGGGVNNTVPTTQSGFYPDGPDILYVVATSLAATASTLVARLTWKEAQA